MTEPRKNGATKLLVHKNGATYSFTEGRYVPKNQFIQSHGYPTVSFRGQPFLVHRLVASGYHQNPLGKPQVNHKNGVRTDSRAENLEWVWPSENIQHSYTVLNRRSNLNKGKGSVYWDGQTQRWCAKITRDHIAKTKKSNDKGVCIAWLEGQRNGI